MGENMIIEEKEYQKLLKSKKDYKRILLNGLEAFIFGGSICLLGQFILYILTKFIDDNALKTSIMVGKSWKHFTNFWL